MSKFLQSLGGAVAKGLPLDPSKARVFLDKNDRPSIVVNGKKIHVNAPATLRYDEWKDLDRQILEVAQERLVAWGDVISAGLVHNMGSIGQTLSQWEKVSDTTGASVGMEPGAVGDEDTVNYDTASVPVPVVQDPWRLNMRRLAASRLIGEDLEATQGRQAGRHVGEASEDMLLQGSSITVDGSTIYGYTNHPDRNTVDMTEVWTAAGKTGAEILADVQAMLAAARADNHYGPFTLYIPGAYEGKLDDDFDPASADTRTIRERLLQLQGLVDIKVVDRMPANNVVLVELTRETVDIAIAQDITTINWQERGGMVERFLTMAVWAPRVKSDYDGQCGVVHLYEIP